MIWRSLGQAVSGQRGWKAKALGAKAINGAYEAHRAHTPAELSYRVPLVPAFSILSTV